MSNLTNGASEAQMIELLNSIKLPIMGAGGGFAPIGTINFFDASVAPQGWLACDGSVVNIADYPELAIYYASVHGSSNFYGGDGTTTFAVPDLRGEFLRGTGTNSHTNQGSGANVGVHQDGTETPSSFAHETANSLYVSRDNGFLETADNLKQVSGNNQVYASGSTQSPGYYFTSRPTNTSFLICVKATVSDSNPTPEQYHVYTPNEHIVGEWQEVRDGLLKKKPVYEKVIDCGALPNNTTKLVDTNITNLEKCISFTGVAMYGSSQAFSLPFIYNTQTSSIVHSLEQSGAKVRIITFSDYSTYTAYSTVQYTKTTDQWQVV